MIAAKVCHECRTNQVMFGFKRKTNLGVFYWCKKHLNKFISSLPTNNDYHSRTNKVRKLRDTNIERYNDIVHSVNFVAQTYREDRY